MGTADAWQLAALSAALRRAAPGPAHRRPPVARQDSEPRMLLAAAPQLPRGGARAWEGCGAGPEGAWEASGSAPASPQRSGGSGSRGGGASPAAAWPCAPLDLLVAAAALAAERDLL